MEAQAHWKLAEVAVDVQSTSFRFGRNMPWQRLPWSSTTLPGVLTAQACEKCSPWRLRRVRPARKFRRDTSVRSGTVSSVFRD